jgi:hypothetical protein
MDDIVDLAIYVGALDYYWEWHWLPRPPEPPLPEELIVKVYEPDDRQSRLEKIKNWREQMTNILGDRLSAPLDWDENDQWHAVATPGGKCWTALMLWTAYAEFSEEPPAVLGPPDLAEKNPIFQRLERSSTPLRFRQIVQCIDYWLPAAFDAVVESPGPFEEGAFVGSSPVLLKELEALNDATWKVDRATIQQWSDAGAPADDGLESQARYAFAELLLVAQLSCDHRLPMKYYFDLKTLLPDLLTAARQP